VSDYVVALPGSPDTGIIATLACKVCGEKVDITTAAALLGEQRRIEDAFVLAHGHAPEAPAPLPPPPREPLDAYLFAEGTLTKDGKRSDYRFGIRHDRAIAALRRLADDLQRGDLLFQDVKVETLANNNEWVKSTLTINYVERRPAPEETK
jgi:hypothetical protein